MSYYPNRTVCSVLEEMRKANETRNYSILLSLIEEVQTLVNRMEASLYDIKDMEHMLKEKSKLKKKLKALEAKVEKLEDDPK